jgi:hypothetical protein
MVLQSMGGYLHFSIPGYTSIMFGCSLFFAATAVFFFAGIYKQLYPIPHRIMHFQKV